MDSLVGSGLRAIVGRKDDEGVIREFQVVQGIKDLSHIVIDFENEIPVITGAGFALEIFIGNNGCMRTWGIPIDKKRVLAI